MDEVNSWGILAGSSRGPGIDLYLDITALGIANHLRMTALPGNMEKLDQYQVIGLAVILYRVEFPADEIPLIGFMKAIFRPSKRRLQPEG